MTGEQGQRRREVGREDCDDKLKSRKIAYMIKVGIFWVSVLLGIDIIFDIEEYPDDYQSKDMLLTYSKQHKDVWGRLSKEQCSGKYSIYKFDVLPRGRVWYDLEEKTYKIVFYRGSKEFIDTIAPKIKNLFGIDKAEVTKDCIVNTLVKKE